MSNTGSGTDEIPLLNTDNVHATGVDTSPPPLQAADLAVSPPPPMDSPQVPIENASSGLVSDLSPSVPPASTTRGRKRGRASGGGSNSVSGRKPGRPRKFEAEHALPMPSRVVENVIQSQPNSSAVPAVLTPLPTPPNYISAPLPPLARPSSPSSSAQIPKRKPGRPFGTGKKQQTRGSTSTAPIPPIARPNHLIGIPACDVEMKAIIVSPGEDVVEKLTIFAQQDTKSMFIQSAYGSVSSATLRPPTASTELTTHKGFLQIISLCGSLIQVETHGQRTWIGGLSVSLTAHDNQSHVGGVAGSMIAATPVQIIVGSFNLEDEDKAKLAKSTHVNDKETGSPAANGAVNESDSGGGVAGTSIPDNSGA